MMTDPRDDLDGDDVRYDRQTGTFRLSLERADSDSPSVAIVNAIASIEGFDPVEMDPIARYVDPDALDALLESDTGNTPPFDGSISLTYEGYRVSTAREGELVIEPVEGV